MQQCHVYICKPTRPEDMVVLNGQSEHSFWNNTNVKNIVFIQ